jgi:phage-related protein
MDEFDFLPDWQAQGTTTANVSKVQFGDGYVQRQNKGMNPLKVSWGLSFNPRSDDETDDIENFLIAREGVTAFTWTPPGQAQAKWVCSQWTRTKMGDNVNSITMTFEKVYEP